MEILDQLPQQEHEQKTRTIDEVITNGYEFRFGEYLSQMFSLLKPTWLYLLGHTGVLILGVIILELILIFGAMGSFFMMDDPGSIDPQTIMPKFLALYFLIIVILSALIIPFRAGIYVFLQKGTRTGSFDFGDFFDVYKTKWLKITAMGLLIMIISVIWIFIPMGLIMSKTMTLSSPDELDRMPLEMMGMMGWIFLAYIPMFFFLIVFSLAIPLLLFQTNNISQAMTGSFRIVLRKFFHFLGLYFVVMILSYAGLLVCGVGMLVTINFFPLVIFSIYRDIFGIPAAPATLT